MSDNDLHRALPKDLAKGHSVSPLLVAAAVDVSVQPHVTPIDPRERETIINLARQARLLETDPRLALDVRCINFDRPSSLDRHVWAAIVSKVKKITGGLEENPFVPGPPALLQQGALLLGIQKADGQPLQISQEELARHALFISSSGGGKTTAVHILLHQLLRSA